jgi:hypothetical protein
MNRRGRLRLLPALLALAACGGPAPSESPSFYSARLAPGTSFPVVIRIFATPALLTGAHTVQATGPATEVVPFTICGITVAYRSELVSAPASDPPSFGGATDYQLFAAQPIPSGTRLEVTHICGNALDATFSATVVQGVD